MEVLYRVFGALAIFAAFFGIYAWHRRGRSRVGRSWRALASRIGAKVTHDNEGFWFDPYYKLEAKLDGFRVKLEYYRRAGRHSPTYTRARVPTPFDFELWIQRQGIVQTVVKLVGGQDLELGDPEYDEVFVIKSNAHERVRRLFTPELARLHLATPEAAIYVDKDGVAVDVEGLVIDHERCLDLLDLAVASARAFASGRRAEAS